jgi:hypothetical protein
LGRQIDHRRRKIKLAAEPRFYRVPVGRRHIGQMIGKQGAVMAGDDFLFDPFRIGLRQSLERLVDRLPDSHWGFSAAPNPDAVNTLKKAVASVFE